MATAIEPVAEIQHRLTEAADSIDLAVSVLTALGGLLRGTNIGDLIMSKADDIGAAIVQRVRDQAAELKKLKEESVVSPDTLAAEEAVLAETSPAGTLPASASVDVTGGNSSTTATA